MSQLHQVAFIICVFCIVVGTIMAIVGMWIPRSDTGWKLFMTDVIICAGCGLIAAITKWLT